jgi:phosphoglycolate phosphatase
MEQSKSTPRRAVIFDLDGTLVDTVEDLTAALNRLFVELGLPPHAQEAVCGMVGDGLGKLLDRGIAAHGAHLGPKARQKAVARFIGHHAVSPAAHSTLYPGTRETLAALHEAGVACGLCTNKPGAISRSLLETLGIARSFGVIQGADAGVPRKPDPTGLIRVVKALGAEPDTTFMVGDSTNDLKAARAAGLAGVVLVSYGYSAIPVAELGPDVVINSLHELVPALAVLGPGQ